MPAANNFSGLCRLKLFETQSATYFFTQRDYELVGKEVVTSLLDLVDRNPVSRVLSSPVKNMRALKYYFALKVIGEELPYKNDPLVKLFQTSDFGEQGGLAEQFLRRYLEAGKLTSDDVDLLKQTTRLEPSQPATQVASTQKKVGAAKSKVAPAKKPTGAAAVKPKPKVEVTYVPRKTEHNRRQRKLSVPPENGYQVGKPSSSGLEAEIGYRTAGTRERVGRGNLEQLQKYILPRGIIY